MKNSVIDIVTENNKILFKLNNQEVLASLTLNKKFLVKIFTKKLTYLEINSYKNTMCIILDHISTVRKLLENKTDKEIKNFKYNRNIATFY